MRKTNFNEKLTNVGADLIIGFKPSTSPCGSGGGVGFGSEKVEMSERVRNSGLVLRWREYALVVGVGIATEMCEAVWEIT